MYLQPAAFVCSLFFSLFPISVPAKMSTRYRRRARTERAQQDCQERRLAQENIFHRARCCRVCSSPECTGERLINMLLEWLEE
ncbi:hypothetical protein K457DRAFT_355423 [Linnemannia elongata AG-77]|uniref:Secreted protein n=1 Tax=Linnemannia elongata AG-77 TaxID=1314771 RepID=A0A197K2V7_9FUNG|nr:hypothetical protein K457DRAFT_355423 [Linnemannia elongata AG-77]